MLAARPGDGTALADFEQLRELFLEQVVIIGQFIAKEREALDEGAAARHDLGTTVGNQVEGRKLLPDADRIFRAQHGYGGRKADGLGTGGGGGKDGYRGGGDKVGAVVFAQAIEIQTDLFGQFDFFEQVPDPFGG